MEFPVVNLPDEFCYLLRINLNKIENRSEFMANFITGRPGLHGMIRSCYGDEGLFHFNKVKTLGPLGWVGIRDLLAGIYLFKTEHGSFPSKLEIPVPDSLNKFESELRPYTIEGHSRIFLLRFYLEMAGLEKLDGEIKDLFSFENLNSLKLLRSKVVHLDWFILLLVHWNHFFGANEVFKLMAGNATFEQFYDGLRTGQKKTLISNLLKYGMSIGEQEFFLNNLW